MQLRMTMRMKFGVMVGALVVVCFALLGSIAAAWVEQHVAELQGKRLRAHALRLATALDVGLFERLREVSNLAESRRAERADVLARDDLDRMRRTFPHYAWIGLTDPQGSVLMASDGLLEGTSVQARPWWQAGRQKPVVVDVHPATLLASLLPPRPDGEPLRLLDVAVPVVDGGRVVGVLGAHLDWDWAREVHARVMEAVRPDERIELFLFDRNGKNLGLTGAQALLPSAMLETLVNQPPATVTWPDGERYLTAAVARAGYRNFGGLGWQIVVRQPAALVVAPAADVVRIAWIVSAAMAGVLVFWIWVAAGRVLKPLRAVAAEALASTEAIDTPDEAEQLAAALAALLARLQAREKELTTLTQALEQKVAQRTAELEARNGELSGLTRVITHDIRAPMLTIAQLLEFTRGSDPEMLSRALAAAIAECRHVGAVIDSLGALMAGEVQPLAQTQVDMAALARAAAQRQGLLHSYAGTLEIAELPPAWGDPVLLGEVWENLVGNAMKYAGQGPAPRVTVHAEAGAGRTVYRVADNGIGFDPARAADLFTAFSRLVRDARYRGTGLGLAIVKRVVERHDGTVGAEGEPGRGAAFWFALPDRPGHEPGPASDQGR